MIIKSAEILCVGTEIIIGDIVNTNAAYISKTLAKLGISQYYQAAVGDNPKRLADAIKNALNRCDLLIMSGGLGPTYDDLTKETVANAMGREMYLHQEALDRIKNYFAIRCKTMTENNIKQAMIPVGSTVFLNDNGTAPGCAVEDFDNGKIVIMLPGPPHELIKMFEDKVIDYLRQYTQTVLISKNIDIFGMGESEIESHIGKLMKESTNPTIAPYCGVGEVRLRVTASGKDVQSCSKMCDDMIENIKNTAVGPYIYGIDTNFAEAVVKNYTEKCKTLAFAESCTGGLISKTITDIPGSSAMFKFSAITYANEAKISILGVSPNTIEKYGAVSEQTAKEMAIGVKRVSNSDVGISVTGIAGPNGQTKEKPIGLVYIGISTKKETKSLRLDLRGDRDRIRSLSCLHALSAALREILDM